MTFSKEQINSLKKPYQELGTGDKLAEHRELLADLTPGEQHALATKMLLQCPAKELNDFGYAIKALEHTNSFHTVLNRAFEIRKKILSLVDPRNTKPYLLFLDKEFEPDFFVAFPELTEALLKHQGEEIAKRFALTTPEVKHGAVVAKMQSVYPSALLLLGQIKAAYRTIPIPAISHSSMFAASPKAASSTSTASAESPVEKKEKQTAFSFQ